jgi:hypothetical protein
MSTSDLVDAISDGITRRGFYLLTDDRLSLICGDDYAPNDLTSKRDNLNDFAKKHGWSATVHGGSVMFLPQI